MMIHARLAPIALLCFAAPVLAIPAAPPIPQPPKLLRGEIVSEDRSSGSYMREELDTRVTIHFGQATDPDLVTEECDIGPDGQLLGMRYEQKQYGAKGTILVKDGRVHYSYSREGKTETDTEELDRDKLLVAPCTLHRFIERAQTTLRSGEPLHARLALIERHETVGITIRPQDAKACAEGSACPLTIRPSSFILALLFPAIEARLTGQPGARVAEFYGPIPLGMRDGDGWKSMKARIRLEP